MNVTDQAFRVAIVDDDADLQELLTMRLSESGFRVRAFRSLAEAEAHIDRESFDVVLLDLRLAEGDGLSLLASLASRGQDVPVVVLTAHGTIDTAVEAIRLGADDFLTKPFHAHELLDRVRSAATRGTLRREVRQLRRKVQDDPNHLIGVSPAIGRVRELIERVGPTDATVLITGESGTGKELVARALHARSARAGRRFVALNCAAVPEHLVEAELFGCARGAFTDAHGERDGLLAAAEGSTLFLDEIGDAPLAVQAKLLRVLEERQYRPIGTTEPVDADVRIVAATNRNLAEMVAAGRVRADLMFRLRVVPVHLPPLRDRRVDIPLLASVFAERAATRYGRPQVPLSSRALEALVAHDWPGNVRELANVVERAVLCGHEIAPADLERTPAVAANENSVRVENVAPEWCRELLERFGHGAEVPSLREARAEFERAYVRQVLHTTKGNVSAAARIARRNRSEFYEIMKRVGIGTSRRGEAS